MFIEYPKFKSLELEDYSLISKHLARCSRKICELNLANLVIWKDFDRPEYTFINDNLCILISPPTEPPYFLEPLSHNKLIETVKVCLQHAGRISRASESLIVGLPRGVFHYSCLRNQFDYVYQVSELAELKGKKFDGKRNQIKKFQHRFPKYEFVQLESGSKDRALELFERWFESKKDTAYFTKLSYMAQRKALVSAFLNFEKLEILGGALIAENALRGFIMGSVLTAKTVAAHFSYTDPEYPGVSQTLLWEACNHTFSAYTNINLEQDLGIPGLRQAKLSYHPLRLEKKFEIKPL